MIYCKRSEHVASLLVYMRAGPYKNLISFICQLIYTEVSMIIRQFSLNQTSNYPIERDYNMSQIAFFDIETTGFAADSSYLYLIGCAFYKEDSFHLIQWFSEGIKEEAQLIHAFFDFIKDYKILLHYNGTTFDLPYLAKKCTLLGLDYTLDQLTSVDLYKKLYSYRQIFKLKSFKQKSIENFLGINRTDTFGGGDLIEVYQSFLGKRHLEKLRSSRLPEQSLAHPSEADQLLHALLLHNEDDIRGLIHILPILAYSDLFEKPIRILQAMVEEAFFYINFELSSHLPVPVSFGNDLVKVTAQGTTASMRVAIYEGELKYFYDNYKDYYYLPAEDSVVHKSIAEYVDKNYRVKAKADNCYTKKQGIFAPQYEPVITPCFKLDHKAKLSFLEIHTDFLLQEDNLELYVAHLLQHVI